LCFMSEFQRNERFVFSSIMMVTIEYILLYTYE
jgi:hypothetical protein